MENGNTIMERWVNSDLRAAANANAEQSAGISCANCAYAFCGEPDTNAEPCINCPHGGCEAPIKLAFVRKGGD